jgi:hypothetical protein
VRRLYPSLLRIAGLGAAMTCAFLILAALAPHPFATPNTDQGTGIQTLADLDGDGAAESIWLARGQGGVVMVDTAVTYTSRPKWRVAAAVVGVLRQAMSAPPAAAPDLMKTRAWALKSLNSALGSWTELRHDTILYAKQSVIAEGGGDEMPQTVGHVEPYPDFYRGLGGLAKATRDGSTGLSLLDLDTRAKLDAMVELCTGLAAIADKELAGQVLTENERALIYGFGGSLEYLGMFVAEDGRRTTPADEKSPVVADVHTDLAFTKQALEEATGYPLALYAVLPIEGRPQPLVGACYDHYEFTVPMDQRLTDEEWQAQLDGGKAPARPRWTWAFIVR